MPTTPSQPHPRIQEITERHAAEDRAQAARTPDFLFQPRNPSAEFALIHQLASPDLSLCDIARKNRTTPAALALWMSRPDIAEKITATKTAAANRNQFVAQFALADAITSLHTTVKKHPEIEADPYLEGYSVPHLDYKRHTRETARKAANLLHRIAHPSPKSRAHLPLPEGGGGGVGSRPTTDSPPQNSADQSPLPEAEGPPWRIEDPPPRSGAGVGPAPSTTHTGRPIPPKLTENESPPPPTAQRGRSHHPTNLPAPAHSGVPLPTAPRTPEHTDPTTRWVVPTTAGPPRRGCQAHPSEHDHVCALEHGRAKPPAPIREVRMTQV